MKISLRGLLGLQTRMWVVVLAALLFGIGGFVIRSRHGGDMHGEHGTHQADSEKQSLTWTCSMHPQIKQPEPGKCPLCGMDLIPLKTEAGDDLGERMMTMSEAAMKLAEVRTQPAERRFVDIEIPLIGKIDYDETRVKTISSWVDGRLDRLFVDYTGVPVKKGEHLVEIYSPELYAAQEELLQAIKTESEVRGSDSEYIRKSSSDTVASVREKLRLLGLKEEQIAQIEKQKKPTARIEITAPIGGIVIHKNAKEGMYVKTGTPIYTVADLSKLWVKLDAYESDLAWIKYGQEVEIRTESYGDKMFKGWISFVDPILNPETRTVKVRVLVDNPKGLLRPNMFVRAIVKTQAGEEGAVLTSNLDGKWICPMHPEVVKDKASACTVCGMDLVKAETLGYATKQSAEPPLILPSSAVLITGKRALVYVRLKNRDKPTFEGREVELGPRAGDFYIILAGINEGDDVVVNGNFKIDSALQLVAKPSMMSPEGGVAPQAHHGEHSMPAMKQTAATEQLNVPDAFKNGITGILRAYYEIQKALAGDDPEEAGTSSRELAEAVTTIQSEGLSAQAQEVWKEQKALIDKSAKTVSSTQDIQEQRQTLPSLTVAVETLARTFGPFPDLSVRKAFCPMAFDNKGAFWLQENETIENPYFGDAMLRCGEIKDVLSTTKPEGHQHEKH
ncbi:efflux RND transporter periplasmic adaptor subunit [Verrucomicrobiota bacterium]